MLRRAPLLAFALSLAACGGEGEMRIVNQLEQSVSIDVLAPREDLRGGCTDSFLTRFCKEEFVEIGVIDVGAGEDRDLIISDTVNDEQCTNVLWLRLPWLGELGPVADSGTTFQLPAVAEVELGPGRFHGVAFPAATVRIDEVGPEDMNQGPEPQSCASLGRTAR